MRPRPKGGFMYDVKFLKDGKTCLRYSTVKASEVMRLSGLTLQGLLDEILEQKWMLLSESKRSKVVRDAFLEGENNETKKIKRKI